MTTNSKGKVVSIFRKWFRSSDKIATKEREVEDTANSKNSSFVAHRHDAANQMDNPGTSRFFKAKKSIVNKSNDKVTLEPNVRLRRLMKEIGEIQRMQNKKDSTFSAELIDDNLFEWYVKLHRIDPESELATDMREFDIPHILLHVIFPENFPFSPPFMRVISPRIEKGFVMEGGAICMELLTPRGWASAYTVEAVITQFAASVVKGQGRIARKSKTSKEFNQRTAEESFRSLVKTHEKYGWVTPPLAEG